MDFTVNGFFMKLIKTSNRSIITECQQMFKFVSPTRAHTLEASGGKVSRSYAYDIYIFCVLVRLLYFYLCATTYFVNKTFQEQLNRVRYYIDDTWPTL